MKTFEADQSRGIKVCLKQSLHATTQFTIHGSKNVQEEVQLKIEKTNKKYKASTNKKRRQKLFEEEDMMMVYLGGERILAKRVPTEQLNPN